MVRLLDVLLTLVLALLGLPILLLAALWVMAVDLGNPFYTQRRVGLHGREFTIFKLRTMRRAAPDAQAQFCGVGDPRILRGGHLLRKLRIDEIPQFLNVLLGDMALVGPRPEQPAFVEVFERTLKGYHTRHLVRPGITGLAQVCMGYVDDERGTSRKLRYDRFYIRHFGLGLWLLVVTRTVKVVLRLGGR